MESESKDINQSSVKDDVGATETKQEHIKQRLKDLGVSDDSTRPEKSWFSRYGNYLMLAIIVSLGVVYWLEYSNQYNPNEQTVAKVNVPATNPTINFNPHARQTTSQNTRKNNPYKRNNTSPDAYQAQWLQRQAQHRKAMQQAWQRQQTHQKEWLKQQRDQQARAWANWQKYIKQQQKNNQYYSAGYPTNQTAGNRKGQPGNTYPRNQWPPRYQQPYSNNPYYNRW